jgi:hypothetical protein
VPASPLDDPSAAPFAGTVAPGEHADGVYVFTIPEEDRGSVTVSVGYQAARRSWSSPAPRAEHRGYHGAGAAAPAGPRRAPRARSSTGPTGSSSSRRPRSRTASTSRWRCPGPARSSRSSSGAACASSSVACRYSATRRCGHAAPSDWWPTRCWGRSLRCGCSAGTASRART